MGTTIICNGMTAITSNWVTINTLNRVTVMTVITLNGVTVMTIITCNWVSVITINGVTVLTFDGFRANFHLRQYQA